MTIKVALIDDHPLVLEGLQAMLQRKPNITVTAQYSCGRDLLEGLRTAQPDVLLLDLQLGNRDAGELVPVLKKDYPAMGLILLTSHDSVYTIQRLLNAGADGYVLKNTQQELLAEAIERVYEGEIYLAPGVKDILLASSHTLTSRSRIPEPLSPRETEVLKLIAEEYTSQEIGEKLYLSYRTIETYRQGIMQKLGVKNMVGMVKKAIMLGLVK